MDWWIVAIVLGQLAFVGWILWVLAYFKVNQSKQRAEERLRLLERFGSSQELADFLASEAGDKLITNFVPRPAGPRAWIVIGLSTGTICLFVGAGFLILARHAIFGDPDVFFVPGVLTCLGSAGILFATAVSTWLVRRWDTVAEREGES